VTQRVLFVIRGKLGDSLVCHAAVQAYARAHPGDETWLLIRNDYARLVAGEPGVRLIPFGSRIEMIARLAWLRISRPQFDVLAVLWGFGKPIERIAQMVDAKRKLYINGRLPSLYPEFPSQQDFPTLVDPARLVIQLFDPGFVPPDRLSMPSLAALRSPAGTIGVIPISDEPRRNLDIDALSGLLKHLLAHQPGKRIWIFLNERDAGALELARRAYPPEVEVKRFRKLTDLVHDYACLDAWIGTDTGLYHLAVAMGIPATVFYGPTQPRKIVMPGQQNVVWVRLADLRDEHCEVKSCTRPLCLHRALANFTGQACATEIGQTPAACPLRSFAPQRLLANNMHENPHTQA
jgi:ADP-heptose:LPS heptosyltransferase